MVLLIALAVVSVSTAELEQARDRQDRAVLEKIIGRLAAEAGKQPDDASAHYRLALAGSYLAEVWIELGDRNQARTAAEAGIGAAQRAVALKPSLGEYHRVLGTLCGQVVPAMKLAGLRYGRCAKESIDKAVELDPKSSLVILSRGVGSYYLPPMFGGGVEPAIRDFESAIRLNPRSADAYLWLGIALRKANRPGEARKAFGKSLELNPRRIWTRQQLDKTAAP